MKKHRSRVQTGQCRRWRGQSLVEIALVTPILLSLLVLTIDLGRALSAYNQVGSMARAGALYGSLHPDDESGITAAARGESSLDGATPDVDFHLTDDSFAVPNSTPATDYQKITVTVTYDFKPLFSFPPLTDGITLRRSAEMRVTGS